LQIAFPITAAAIAFASDTLGAVLKSLATIKKHFTPQSARKMALARHPVIFKSCS
jgi:hypothetical protein